jgi:hypothetical protein
MLGLLRTHRWTVIGYSVVLVLAIVGAKLGEAYSLWFYLLALPMAVVGFREMPRSIAEAKVREVERQRVRAVARERGYERHVRRDDR